MLNLNKFTKTKPEPTLIIKNCSNEAQNSSDNFRFYPPYSHTSSEPQMMSTGGEWVILGDVAKPGITLENWTG